MPQLQEKKEIDKTEEDNNLKPKKVARLKITYTVHYHLKIITAKSTMNPKIG